MGVLNASKRKQEKPKSSDGPFKSSQGEGKESEREDQMHLFTQGMASKNIMHE